MAVWGTIIVILAWVGLGLLLFAILYGLSRFLGRERKRPEPFNYGADGDWPAIPHDFHARQINAGRRQDHAEE